MALSCLVNHDWEKMRSCWIPFRQLDHKSYPHLHGCCPVIPIEFDCININTSRWTFSEHWKWRNFRDNGGNGVNFMQWWWLDFCNVNGHRFNSTINIIQWNGNLWHHQMLLGRPPGRGECWLNGEYGGFHPMPVILHGKEDTMKLWNNLFHTPNWFTKHKYIPIFNIFRTFFIR